MQTLLGLCLVLVLAVVGGTLWLNLSQDDLLPAIIEKLPENVDLGLDRVHYSQNENGKRIWVLDAERAAYQREEEVLDLQTVALIFYDAGRFGELTLSADSGQLRQKEKRLDVLGAVRITAASGEQFRTDSLRYDFARRQITTAGSVEMQGRQLTLRGIGMVLDLDTGRLRILKDVRALLEVSSFAGESR